MSADQALAMLRDIGMSDTMLKPMQGPYRPDSAELPVTSDYDFCPYPANIECPQNSYYRTIDGSCNNVANPLIGRSMTPFRRLLRPSYSDGLLSHCSLISVATDVNIHKLDQVSLQMKTK